MPHLYPNPSFPNEKYLNFGKVEKFMAVIQHKNFGWLVEFCPTSVERSSFSKLKKNHFLSDLQILFVNF